MFGGMDEIEEDEGEELQYTFADVVNAYDVLEFGA